MRTLEALERSSRILFRGGVVDTVVGWMGLAWGGEAPDVVFFPRPIHSMRALNTNFYIRKTGGVWAEICIMPLDDLIGLLRGTVCFAVRI